MESNYMKRRYISLLETTKFSDCCFLIDNEKIFTHKLMLAACSPVFEAMLFGPLTSTEILIKDISASEFRQMLRFIYSDYVQISSIINAWSLVYIAKKYLINDLLTFCLSYISKELQAANILLNYEFADLFSEEQIRDVCMKNIRMYAKVILNCDYHMKSSTLCDLLEQNDFNANEEDLITASVKWARGECKKRNVCVTKENIRAILNDVGAMPRLRFLTLPLNDNCSTVQEMLNEDEINYLKTCQREESSGNVIDLPCLRLSANRSPRNTVPLLQKMGFRRVLKIGDVYHASGDCKLTTQMVVNKCVLVNGFLLPSRRAPETSLPSSDYTEHLNITITDLASKKTMRLSCIETVTYGTIHTVKTTEPFLFEPFKKYDIDITWSSNYLHCSNEYLMNYFPSVLINKDVRFEFNDPFDCGFILGICYCSL